MLMKLSIRMSVFIGLLMTLIAVPVFATGQSQPKQKDSADLYEIYERDQVLVEFNPSETVRLRANQPQNLNQTRSALATDPLQTLTIGGEWLRANNLSEAEINTLRERAEAYSGKAQPDLNNRLRLVLPEGLEALEAQTQLSQLAIVSAVHFIPKPVYVPLQTDYSQFSGNPSNTAYQKYLDAAPNGLDARYAWQIPKGDGFGIKICDVEYDYNENHADVNNVTFVGDPADPPTDPGFNDNHGTAVLGMVGGSDNAFGVKGIAYGASLYFAAAKTTTGGYDVGAAVLACASALSVGDVILIEQQFAGPNYVSANAPSQVGLIPVEWHKPWYDDIKTAVAMGMIVVEAAGNGAQNLDSATYNTGHAPFKTSNDSGAIIVGAAKPPGTGARSAADFSNYGATVDLQGWGGSILTTGYSDLHSTEGKDLWYTDSFGGTSGASPMVTGSAAILQAIYKNENGSTASPANIKTILRNTGTAQTGTKNIGPMPNLRAAINSVAAVTPVSKPVLSHASGTYSMPLAVTISYAAGQSSSNTHIRYTLNGSEPTFNSFIYLPSQGDQLILNYGVTLKAKAFKVGGGESESQTAVYVSNTPKVATPVINPGTGTYNQGTQIAITTSTSGATIRYRTDGRTPSFFYPGTLYSGPLTLTPGNYAIVARGYKDGYYKSDTASADISINETVLPAPVVYPNGGAFNGSVTVYLGSTVLGATIRYTTDGSTPSASSPQFSEPLVLDETTTLKTRVYLDGYTPSPVVEKTFTITQQAAPPTFSPPSGTTATGTLNVTMSTVTAGATIRYTTNGAEPTSYSAVYTSQIALSPGAHTVKAKAFLAGASASTTTTANYTVHSPVLGTVQPVIISPNGGNHTEEVIVTLSTTTQGASIYYTINELGDPTTSDTLYTGPFTLEDSGNFVDLNSFIIRARGFKTSFAPSSTSQTNFNVFTPVGTIDPPPSITPNGGTFTNTVSVKINAFTNPPFTIRQIYYTQDGTDPVTGGSGNSSSPKTISVFKSQTLKAVGTQLGWHDSAISEAEFILVCDTPTLTPSGVYTGSVEVSMSSGTSLAKIYYTDDGTEPTTSSTLYNAPFTITETTTVRSYCTKTNFNNSEEVTAVYAFEEPEVAPTMTQQPSNQSGQQCGQAEFNALATGTPDPTYQWMKDGDLIAGENEPTLSLSVLHLADAGTYTVVASNSAGDVTSTAATLTVSGTDDSCFGEVIIDPEVIIDLEEKVYLPLVVR
jgi:serine protease